ncbi:MAG: hypothetical protein LBM28_03995 [Oscillospiraceae bacterium]|jgi:hypothetical protein|nr:hypothetical protein [Oscillospiraceae bacterium]
MRIALDLFNASINSLQAIELIRSFVEDQTRGKAELLDCSDLLRWQLVQVVSALDKFIHDIVRIGMIESYKGTRAMTKKYKDFKVGLDFLNAVETASTQVEKIRLFEQKIAYQFSYQSFQTPETIGDALSYIWDESHKWNTISQGITPTISEADVKTQLKNISVRRNQIVHLVDCPSFLPPFAKQSIICEDVGQSADFIKKVVASIYQCVC